MGQYMGVSSAFGDFNGDGLDDLITSGSGEGPDGDGTGTAVVFIAPVVGELRSSQMLPNAILIKIQPID